MSFDFVECRYHFSHWYSVWMWTTCSNLLLLCYLKGEFYFVPTSISLNLARENNYLREVIKFNYHLFNSLKHSHYTENFQKSSGVCLHAY